MPKTKLQIMAQRAIDGNQEALDYLDLEESDVKWTTASTLTWETLCGNYNYCAHVLVVATHLKLDTMCTTSCYALQSLTWIARHHYNKELPPIATTCRVEDIAQMMALIIDDVPPPHLNSATSESEEKEEPAPKKMKKKKKKLKNQKKNKKKRSVGDPLTPRPH